MKAQVYVVRNKSMLVRVLLNKEPKLPLLVVWAKQPNVCIHHSTPLSPLGIVNARHFVSWQTVASLLAGLLPAGSGLLILRCGDNAVNAP